MGAPVLNAAVTDVSVSGGLEIGRKLFRVGLAWCTYTGVRCTYTDQRRHHMSTITSTRTTKAGVTLNTHACGTQSVVHPVGGDFHDKWCETCQSGWLWDMTHNA